VIFLYLHVLGSEDFAPIFNIIGYFPVKCLIVSLLIKHVLRKTKKKYIFSILLKNWKYLTKNSGRIELFMKYRLPEQKRYCFSVVIFR